MRRSSTELKKKPGLRIIFADMSNLPAHEIIVGDFINWQPFYDLYIVNENVVVTIEIAGVDINDFSIYLGKIYMIIDGIRKSPNVLNKEDCVFHNLEIPYGRFNRKIDFPAPIEPRGYQYRIENGILTLRFPILKEKIIPIEEG